MAHGPTPAITVMHISKCFSSVTNKTVITMLKTCHYIVRFYVVITCQNSVKFCLNHFLYKFGELPFKKMSNSVFYTFFTVEIQTFCAIVWNKIRIKMSKSIFPLIYRKLRALLPLCTMPQNVCWRPQKWDGLPRWCGHAKLPSHGDLTAVEIASHPWLGRVAIISHQLLS